MTDLQVRFLGSGDAFGSGGRFQTCILIDAPASKVLIDCGASSLIAMKRFDVEPNSVAAILVSHLHGDHFAGIPFLVLYGQFNRREEPLTVAGPIGVRARVMATMDHLFPGSASVERRFKLDFIELTPGIAVPLVGLRVTAFDVDHASGAPAHALRIESRGKIVAYSGDTAWTDTLIDASYNADLFISEAYLYERPVKYHLDYSTLLANQSRLKCRRIILTHMGEDILTRDDIEFERASDGLTVRV